jgi:hypothetical protein
MTEGQSLTISIWGLSSTVMISQMEIMLTSSSCNGALTLPWGHCFPCDTLKCYFIPQGL